MNRKEWYKLYPYFDPMSKLVQDTAMYDMLANYYKYLDPNKHIRYYQMHLMCMQQLAQAQQMAPNPQFRSPNPTNNSRPAKVRVIHTSPDAPAVDIYVNDQKTFDNMSYYQISGYAEVPAGSYKIDVYPAGDKTKPVLTKTVKVESGKDYTIAAAGMLKDLSLVTVIDSTDVPTNQANVRFWHLSPNAPAVDIAIKDGDILFENVSFKEASDYLTVPAKMYDLEVRPTGKKDPVLTLRGTSLKRNEAYTIVALGLVDGSPRLEATLLKP